MIQTILFHLFSHSCKHDFIFTIVKDVLWIETRVRKLATRIKHGEEEKAVESTIEHKFRMESETNYCFDGHLWTRNSAIVNHNRRKVIGKPSSHSKLILMIGLAIIVSNIFINIVSFKKVNSKYGGKEYDTATYISHIITHLFHDLVVIGIPLSFMIIRFLNRNWRDVLSSLEMIQYEMNLSKQVHNEIRKYAVFAVLFFLAVSIFFMWQKSIELLWNLTWFRFPKDASVWMYRSIKQTYWSDIPNIPHPLAITLGNLSYMSAGSVFATMLAFIFIPIILLKELKRRMNTILIHNTNQISSNKLSTELENWRKHHDLVCCLADDINQCFGPCLLIFLLYANIVFIEYTSGAVLEYPTMKTGKTFASQILKVVIVLVDLFVILYPAQTLKDEVINFLYFI